jgi:hypothetical protein
VSLLRGNKRIAQLKLKGIKLPLNLNATLYAQLHFMYVSA